MHPILDDPDILTQFDSQNLLSSIPLLSSQCQHAYEDAMKVSIPNQYSKVNNLVMCGMGGSGLGARIIESVFGDALSIPLIRVNDYHLPSWVNQDTLVVVSSYSGTTEETLQNFQEAIDKKAKILVIASGSTLIDLAKKYSVPYYQIIPKYNFCNEPRMAIGYSVFGQLAMVSQTKLIEITQTTLNEAMAAMDNVQKIYGDSIPTDQNPAKQLAISLETKNIILVAGKHLLGAAHTFKNQCNENAKHYCDLFALPELNHHLMEGLKFPVNNQTNYHSILINSALYSDRIQKRLQLTAKIIQKNNIETTIFGPQSRSLLSQTFETIQFGAYVVYYLVALHQIDPSPIPWVDYFKSKLK